MPEPLAQSAPEQDPAGPRSLQEVHRTVEVPGPNAGFWRNWKAFAGPAILVSVGYMDPGNWSTDLTAGAKYKYELLWVVAVSSLMAMVLQVAAAKLGVVTGKDLARACRDYYPSWTRIPNWICTEVAIAACDLAEVLGSAVAMRLLFGVPILLGVLITAADVMLLLALQKLGIRKIEAFILVLVASIAGCFFLQLFVLPPGAMRPSFVQMGNALLTPGLREAGMIYIAIGIIGATVMPHNLYLHSAVVQTRKYQRDDDSIRRAIRFNAIDSVLALSLAFLVNASILVMAAVTFFPNPNLTLPDGRPIGDDWIQGAYHTLAPLLGTSLASTLFALSLLASGQSSTVTGTLAGQVVMEGFMNLRIRPWVRRLITRLLAIVPAVIVIGIYGETRVTDLLTLSQVILGIQLPFAMIPLMHFTSSKLRMGRFRHGPFLLIAGWASVIVITALDIYGLYALLFGG